MSWAIVANFNGDRCRHYLSSNRDCWSSWGPRAKAYAFRRLRDARLVAALISEVDATEDRKRIVRLREVACG